MSEAKLQKLEDRVQFLRQEAEAFKRQSYQQADLLQDLVPALSRLTHASNDALVDAALNLSRCVSENSQNVDAIRAVADDFLALYKDARASGDLQTAEIRWRSELAGALRALESDSPAFDTVATRLCDNVPLDTALSPLTLALDATVTSASSPGVAVSRLAATVLALPLEETAQARALSVSGRLHGALDAPEDLDAALMDLVDLLELSLETVHARDRSLRDLVTHLSGELDAVESFLGAVHARDGASLAAAELVQADVGDVSTDLLSVFDQTETISDIREHVVGRARVIRSRMDRFVEEARVQHAHAEQEHRALSDRLGALESELARTRDALATAHERASHDFLTGLYNRRAFEDMTARWLNEGESAQVLSCIIWDIDHFKQVNDTHGHAVGDTVLQSVAGVLGERVAESDLAARLGGEEFVTVVRGAEPNALLAWAESVREQVATLRYDGLDALSVSVSCGIAVCQRGDSLVSLLARADRALYDAKTQGRNRCLLAA